MLTAMLLSLVMSSAVPAQGAAAPQRPATIPLASAKTLKCSFPAYAAAGWVDGKAAMATATEEFGFQIDRIDLAKRSAQIVGTRGAAEASAFSTPTGLNVIEQTPIGNFILTTVFVSGGNGNVLLAAHSRHLGDREATPTASQHAGTCEVLK
jgi:hypothetical protein